MEGTRFEIYKDGKSGYRWTFYAGNGEEIAVASESYTDSEACRIGIRLIQKSTDAPVQVVERVLKRKVKRK